MIAFRLIAAHRAELCTISDPMVGAGEVLIRIGASGACRTDLQIIDAPDALGMHLPVTLGHENAGWVEQSGPDVSGFEHGQAVVVYSVAGCGSCVACLAGLDNACRRVPAGGIGFAHDGGMAEYLVVSARQLVPIHDLDVLRAAALADAGLTSYHAVNVTRRRLRPGSTCIVLGIGGLGHMAVQILAATTPSRIVAVDIREEALRLARDVGAHCAIPADAKAIGHIRELVGPPPGGADVVLDFVGAVSTIQIARSVVSVGGDIAVVGFGGAALPVGPQTLPFEVRVTTPFLGSKAELAEVVALARAGRLTARVQCFPLQDAPHAYDSLRSGRIDGRAIIIPGGIASPALLPFST
jgi:propanol-preferring alcohol dehydrogenase